MWSCSESTFTLMTTEETKVNTRLAIDGPLTIYEVAALRERLAACLGNQAGLELDLGGVTECDASGLQLLCAARKTAGERGKPMRIAGAPQALLDFVRRAGLDPREVIHE